MLHTDGTEEIDMRWTRWRNRFDGGQHLIDHGAVACPVRHADVDVDHCYSCAAFETLEEVEGEMYLYCRPRSSRPTMIHGGF